MTHHKDYKFCYIQIETSSTSGRENQHTTAVVRCELVERLCPLLRDRFAGNKYGINTFKAERLLEYVQERRELEIQDNLVLRSLLHRFLRYNKFLLFPVIEGKRPLITLQKVVHNLEDAAPLCRVRPLIILFGSP